MKAVGARRRDAYSTGARRRDAYSTGARRRDAYSTLLVGLFALQSGPLNFGAPNTPAPDPCIPHAPRGVRLPAVVLVPSTAAASPDPGTNAGTATVFAPVLRDASKEAPATTLTLAEPLTDARAEALAAAGIAAQSSAPSKDRGSLTLVPLPRKPGPLTLTIPPIAVAITLPDGVRGTACTEPFLWKINDPTTATSPPQFRSLFLEGRTHDPTQLAYLALIVATALGGVFLLRRSPAEAKLHSAQASATLQGALARFHAELSEPDAPLAAIATAIARESRRAILRALRDSAILGAIRDGAFADPRTFRELAAQAEHEGQDDLAAAILACASAEENARFVDFEPSRTAANSEVEREATRALLASADAIAPFVDRVENADTKALGSGAAPGRDNEAGIHASKEALGSGVTLGRDKFSDPALRRDETNKESA